MQKRMLWGGVGLCAVLAVAASAGTLYRWTDADGVVSYSDELKRVPEAYRATAERVQTGDLASYERYTPAPAAESATYAERLEQHVERMRALNEQAAAHAAAPQAPQAAGAVSEVRVSRKLALSLPESGVQADAGPIVVEEHRVRDGSTTTHVYVVRQGDRILSVMRPHTNQSDAHWRDLEDVIGEGD
jgi:hypothetical protein